MRIIGSAGDGRSLCNASSETSVHDGHVEKPLHSCPEVRRFVVKR